jgi:hypothetical protein
MAKANFVLSKKVVKNDDPDGMVSNQNAHNFDEKLQNGA